MSPQQQMEQPQKRKRKEKAKLAFDTAKVFDPTEAKKEDIELDLDSGRYSARKGQGGDRRGK